MCFGAAAYLLVKILVTLYGNKRSFIYMCILTILSSVVLYITFSTSPPLYVMIMLGLIMCFTQGASLLTWMMVTDCADEIQWQTKKNAAGIASSTLTFSNKFGSAIGAFILGYTLNAIDYAPGAISQSAETISGLAFLMIVTPIIGKVIALLSMYFYPLNNRYHQQIVLELNKEIK